MTFTVYRSPFTLRYLFSVFYNQRLMVNGRRMDNGRWKTDNGFGGKA